MNENDLKYFINNLPDDEPPEGHLERFRSRLHSEMPIQKKLWNLQRYLTAASIALFIAGTAIILTNLNHWSVQTPTFAKNSSDLNETEIYLKNGIERRIQLLTDIGRVDRDVISELNSDDRSFLKMRRDLRRNPGDVRLTCAVLETYQLKIEVLDNIIEKVR